MAARARHPKSGTKIVKPLAVCDGEEKNLDNPALILYILSPQQKPKPRRLAYTISLKVCAFVL